MADVIDILSILDNVLGNHKSQGRNEYLWHCPFCSHHKSKLAVNVELGRWHCWVCESRGHTLVTLLKKVNAPRKSIKELASILHEPIKFADVEETTILVLPTEFQPIWKPTRDYEYRHAMVYLKRRGITESDIIKHNIGFCSEGEYANRVVIPSYDKTGVLNYFTARAYRDFNPPYKNPPASKDVVGFESLISWEFPIVLCEGVMDAIAIRRNAIPLFGKTLPDTLRYRILDGVKDVYIALDPDAQKKALEIAQMLVQNDVNVWMVDLEQDPGEMGFERIRGKMKEAKQLTYGDIVQRRIWQQSIH